MKLWRLLKEVGLTVLGAACIGTQIFSSHPNGLLIGAGLALTVPDTARAVKALLPGGGESEGGGGESSPSPPAPGRQQPPHS